MQHAQISTLGRSNSLAGAATCIPANPDHSATISGHVGSAAGDPAWRPSSPCPWAWPQPPTRHSQACWSAQGRALSRSAHLHHRLDFRALRHSPCCRRRRRRSSAKSSSCPPAAKRMCDPGASASARLAPWKGHRRCTFPWRRPRAICGHPAKSSAHKAHMAHLASSRFALSQAQSEPLRSRLDPLDRE